MKTCREILDFLDDYVSGQLSAGERAEFERHLTACPPCVDYVKSYEQTIRLGKYACTEPCETPPEDLIKAILAARAKRE